MDETRDIVFGIKLVLPPPPRGGPKPRYVPLNIVDFYEVIEEIMSIDPEDMFTVQMYGPDPLRIDVTMLNKDKWNDNEIENHIGYQYLLRSGKKSAIVKPFEELKEVRVRRVPAIWNKDNLMRIFNFYGDIKSIEMENMRPTPSNGIKSNCAHLKSGTYKLKMKLKRDIPSTIVVSGYKLETYHYGQQQTCWTCGMAHFKNECKTEYSDYVNRFNINDFPPITKIRSETLTADQVNAKKNATTAPSGDENVTPDENTKTATTGPSDGNTSTDDESEFMDADHHTDHTYHTNTADVNEKEKVTNETKEENHINATHTTEEKNLTNATETTDEENHTNATDTTEERIHTNVTDTVDERNHINATVTAKERNHINATHTKENYTDERNHFNANHTNAENVETNHVNANTHTGKKNHINANHTNAENKDHINATHTREKSQIISNESKLNLIEPASNDVVNKQADTSDGEGTINRAYDEYIEKENEKSKMTTAQVHKSVNSQEFTDLNSPLYESEETETGKENEQCVIECESSQDDKPMVFTIIGDKGRKRFIYRSIFKFRR